MSAEFDRAVKAVHDAYAKGFQFPEMARSVIASLRELSDETADAACPQFAPIFKGRVWSQRDMVRGIVGAVIDAILAPGEVEQKPQPSADVTEPVMLGGMGIPADVLYPNRLLTEEECAARRKILFEATPVPEPAPSVDRFCAGCKWNRHDVWHFCRHPAVARWADPVSGVRQESRPCSDMRLAGRPCGPDGVLWEGW